MCRPLIIRGSFRTTTNLLHLCTPRTETESHQLVKLNHPVCGRASIVIKVTFLDGVWLPYTLHAKGHKGHTCIPVRTNFGWQYTTFIFGFIFLWVFSWYFLYFLLYSDCKASYSLRYITHPQNHSIMKHYYCLFKQILFYWIYFSIYICICIYIISCKGLIKD